MNSTNYNRPGSLPSLLRDAIKKAGTQGMSAADLLKVDEAALRRTVQTALSRMVIDGSIFAAGQQGKRRYFADAADAEKAREGVPVSAPTKKTPARAVYWTPEHDAILREWYPQHGAAKVAELTGRNVRAVTSRASHLKVKCEVVVRWLSHGGPKGKGPARQRYLENLPIGQQPEHTAPSVTLKKARGPAHQDGPATYHPNFKFTRCPSPTPALRTNTHSQL